MNGHTEIIIWLLQANERCRKRLTDFINETDRMYCEHAFASCEDALRSFEELAPPHVVLLDAGVPDMHWIDAVRAIKGFCPSTFVIILTVDEEERDVMQALRAGASGYLRSASPADDILRAIDDVLNGGAAINPQIARKLLERVVRRNGPMADYGLTERECGILRLAVEGLSKKTIAERLFISHHTVDFHLRSIYSKLEVHTRAAAVTKTLRERLV